MNRNLKRLLPVLTAALTLCTTPLAVGAEDAAAEGTTGTPAVPEFTYSNRAADELKTDADGNTYYLADGEKVTGKFGLTPDYLLGDVNADEVINASDAAVVLRVSAMVGAGVEPGEAWSTSLRTEAVVADCVHVGDVDGSGVVNASDAAGLLAYAANVGAGNNIHPLGFAYYYADSEGNLYTGRFTDPETGDVYYANEDHTIAVGWYVYNDNSYYANAEGVMQKDRWITVAGGRKRYLSENGSAVKQEWMDTEDGTYYFGEDGVAVTGITEIEGTMYMFSSSGVLLTGWQDRGGDRYYLGGNGEIRTGWVYIDGQEYYFQENGVMATGMIEIDGSYYIFDDDGILMEYIDSDYVLLDDMLNNAELEPKDTITVYNRQQEPETVDFSFKISDEDVKIIEKFAAEHFPENSTLAEKLWITHQWIHYNVDYAYVGEKWDEIAGLSYVDAIFNHQKGQCVQYNGAMAAVLAYYGYDVYMVRGWTSPNVQHFWTEVRIGGHTYMVECGNYGKNGEWQDFFELIE